MKLLYTLNVVPSLATPEAPESTKEQKYTDFPYSVKLSQENSFLAVTLFSGEVQLIKMPPILNPLEDHSLTPKPDASTNSLDPKGSKRSKDVTIPER